MIQTIIPLVDWGNGVFMIGVFAAVVVLLSVIVYKMVAGGGKKE
ncbi:hypothetical protein [Luteirhabdus pelagi]|nr:hypothetical protein [Luteirhabdus pelagi]